MSKPGSGNGHPTGKPPQHSILFNHRPCRPLLPFGHQHFPKRRTSRHKPTPFFISYLLIQENIRVQRLVLLGEIPGAPVQACTEIRSKAELLSENGYFGVRESVIRLSKFAFSIAANDPGRLNQVQQGMRKGLKDMETQYGILPVISYQTVDALLTKLETWKDDLLVHALNEPDSPL